MEDHPTSPEVIVSTRTHRALRSMSAQWGLATLSFLESSVLPIILDPFLVMITLARRERWVRYSLIAAAASVVGGVAGYLLGVLFFDLVGVKLVSLYQLEEEVARTTELFSGSVFWVTLFGAVTPIPYKIFALVGGVLQVNLWEFIAASVVGRFARFFLVGFITYRFGETALALFFRHFNYLTAALVVVAALYTVHVLL